MISFLTVLELGTPRSRCWQGRCPRRPVREGAFEASLLGLQMGTLLLRLCVAVPLCLHAFDSWCLSSNKATSHVGLGHAPSPTVLFKLNLCFKDLISKWGCILSYLVGTLAYEFGGRSSAHNNRMAAVFLLFSLLRWRCSSIFLGRDTWCIHPFVYIHQTNPNHLDRLGEQVQVILVTGFNWNIVGTYLHLLCVKSFITCVWAPVSRIGIWAYQVSLIWHPGEIAWGL